MYCPKCGKHNDESVNFCASCGASLKEVREKVVQREQVQVEVLEEPQVEMLEEVQVENLVQPQEQTQVQVQIQEQVQVKPVVNDVQQVNDITSNNINEKVKKGKSKKTILILVICIIGIFISFFGFKAYKGKDVKEVEKNDVVSDDFDYVTSKLSSDYNNGKLSTDEYVRYYLYAAFDTDLLPKKYANLKGYDNGLHVSELVEKHYDELSDETLEYYISKVNLDFVTFESAENVNETDLSSSIVEERKENVTNLDKVVLSSNGNFVVWYTTEGVSKIDIDTAKKVAEGLEITIKEYDKLFNTNYKLNSKILIEGKTYNNQKNILKNNNISEDYLESAMQVYIVDVNSDALAYYYYDSGLLLDLFNKFRDGDSAGVILQPYIVIKPSSFNDFEKLEQIYNHEMFHHYQFEVLCGHSECEMSEDPFIMEATANWASALVTNKTTSYGVLNGWAGAFRIYSSTFMSEEFINKNKDSLGYIMHVYLVNYTSIVPNAINYITDSIYEDDALKYLESKASDTDLYKIQKEVAVRNLTQDYTNKNILVDPDYGKKENGEVEEVRFKDKITDNYKKEKIKIYKMGVDYYLLDVNSSSAFEIKIGGDSSINGFIITKSGNKYKFVDGSEMKNKKFDTNDYGDYDSLYIAVANIKLTEENEYSLIINEIEKKGKDEDETLNDNQTENEDITYNTTFKNYNIEITMDIEISGVTTEMVSKGVVDELHQKEYLDVTTTVMGMVSMKNKVYHDFNSGWSYMTQPYGGDVWYKEKSASQMVDLGIILDKLSNMEDVTKVSDNHFKVKMGKNDIKGLMSSGNANVSMLSGDVYVEVYTENGYITKLEYDFSEMISTFEKFTTTIKCSNYNNAGDVAIPQSIIDSAKKQ